MTTPPNTERAQKAKQNYDEFFRQWWFTLLVMVVLVITATFPDQWIQQLALVHQDVANGEIWRLITSQFVHLGNNHTMLNVVGYVIINACFREYVSPRQEMLGLMVSTLGVGLGIYFFNPEMQWYVGLSGAIYGLLIFQLSLGWRRSPFMALFFVIYLGGKFIYEQFMVGPDTLSAEFIGGMVAIDSHLYGAITGVLLALVVAIRGNSKADARESV